MYFTCLSVANYLSVYPFHHIRCFYSNPLQHYCLISKLDSTYIQRAAQIIQSDYLGDVAHKRDLKQVIVCFQLTYDKLTFLI